MAKTARDKRKAAKAKKRVVHAPADEIPVWRTLSGHTLRLPEMETTHIWNCLNELQERLTRLGQLGPVSTMNVDRIMVLNWDFKTELRRRRRPVTPVQAELDAANREHLEYKRVAYDAAWQYLKQGYDSHAQQVLTASRPFGPPPIRIDLYTAAAWMAFHGHGTYEHFLPPRRRKTKKNL